MYSYKISGVGPVALTAPGSLFKLTLQPGENYIVDPR
jgi:uncharacterized protein (AIM24 family)